VCARARWKKGEEEKEEKDFPLDESLSSSSLDETSFSPPFAKGPPTASSLSSPTPKASVFRRKADTVVPVSHFTRVTRSNWGIQSPLRVIITRCQTLASLAPTLEGRPGDREGTLMLAQEWEGPGQRARERWPDNGPTPYYNIRNRPPQ